MRKKVLLITIIFSLVTFVLSSCTNNDSASSGTDFELPTNNNSETTSVIDSTSTSKTEAVLSSENASDDKEYSFAYDLTFLYKKGENYLPINPTEVIVLDNDKLIVNVNFSFHSINTYKPENYSAKLMLFVDGKLLEYTTDDDMLPSTDKIITVGKSDSITLNVQIEDIPVDKETTIHLICYAIPDFVPKNKYQEANVVVSWSFPILKNGGNNNTSINNDVTRDADDTAYIENPAFESGSDPKVPKVDIGLSYQYKPSQYIYQHINDETIIKRDSDNGVYLKAAFGSDNAISYYAMVFCNGEMLKAFDDDYLIKFNTNCGEKVLNYKITNDCLPTEPGTYSLVAIFIPESLYNSNADNSGLEQSVLSTWQRRVVIE